MWMKVIIYNLVIILVYFTESTSCHSVTGDSLFLDIRRTPSFLRGRSSLSLDDRELPFKFKDFFAKESNEVLLKSNLYEACFNPLFSIQMYVHNQAGELLWKALYIEQLSLLC